MMEGEVLPLRNCHHDKKESKRKREDTASNKFDKFLVEICDIPEDENEGEFGALYGERYDGKNFNNIEEELLTSEIFGYFTSYLRRENAYSYAKNMLSQIRTFFKEKYPMIVEPGHPLGEIPYKTLAKNISDHYVTDSRVKRKPIIEHKLPVREIDNNQLCKMYFVNGDHQMRAMQSLDWVCLGRISELSGLQWRDLLVHRVPTLLVYENCLREARAGLDRNGTSKTIHAYESIDWFSDSQCARIPAGWPEKLRGGAVPLWKLCILAPADRILYKQFRSQIFISMEAHLC